MAAIICNVIKLDAKSWTLAGAEHLGNILPRDLALLWA
jgi:hypothetical protein